MTVDIAAASRTFMRVSEGLPRLLTLSHGTVATERQAIRMAETPEEIMEALD